jgi:hypothetical protein
MCFGLGKKNVQKYQKKGEKMPTPNNPTERELPAKMRGSVPKKLALAARGLCKNTAAGVVGVGVSVFAPRLAPLLGWGGAVYSCLTRSF